ncbi:hypothetical protein ACM40_15695 [Chryseobacterium sp. BLS98]|uniref:GAP1-N1 domain-containing protein n=1 Tax=Chryseobacterium sp. BLS98 TaxID=885586 RepID=UPI00065A9F70|nr:effector-associated domain EAD1-containing protein [Chryseobacterium sp. BLS98]KMQ61138.1 hypothetical protein ACM40_15695 [Chryseobacterium sp. BLS98]
MIIHQSIYGEVDRAWSLIRTSQKDNTFAKNIALKTDLQEQTSGTVWQPAIRGFVIEDHFLIIKTFDDNTEGVRRGRKFSHVLMADINDIIKLKSIKPLFKLLIQEVDKDLQLSPIEFEIGKNSQASEKIVDPRLQKMIYGYIHIAEYKNKILWIGQDSFDIAVDQLWKVLTVPEKKSFNFGVTFNNDQSDNEGINLFSLPDSVANRFIKTENFIVNKKEAFTSEGLLVKILCGDEDAILRLQNFEKIIECNPLSRSEINIVEKVIDTFEEIDFVSDLKKLNTLSHLIAKYSPLESSGASFKKKLLKKIVLQLENCTYKDLSVLRIFKISSYNNSQKILQDCLVKFIQKRIFSTRTTKSDLQEFFQNFKTENDHWWDLKMVEELKLYLNTINSKKVKTVYNWIVEIPEVLQQINKFLDSSSNLEDEFITCLPTQHVDRFWNEIISFCLERKWYKLYAHLLLTKYSMEHSLTELLKVDIDENNYSAIHVIVDKKPSKSIIGYTIANGDPRLIKICGKLCNNEPNLLANIDLFDNNWQKIWIEAINNGNTITDGISNPNEKLETFLNGLIEGKKIDEFLLLKLSESVYGNLINYPNCNNLWVLIENPVKDNFLNKTTTALLEELSKNPSFSIPNDPVIEQHISGKGIADYLYYNSNNIMSVIPVFERFTHLTDRNLEDYLVNYSGSIDAIHAKQLGQLIYRRSLNRSAYVIYKKASKNNNWRFALVECQHLLEFFTRAKIAFLKIIDKVNIPTDEWWSAVHDVVIDLYSNGSSLSTIWQKAGGKESDILISGSCADAWRDLLHKLRYGKIKNVTMNDLLVEINKQYGGNKNFEIIYKLRANYIKTK